MGEPVPNERSKELHSIIKHAEEGLSADFFESRTHRDVASEVDRRILNW